MTGRSDETGSENGQITRQTTGQSKDTPYTLEDLMKIYGRSKTPLVIGVAVRTPEEEIHALPKPYRHHHILNNHWSAHGCRLKGEQGFILSTGIFVSREDAWAVAKTAGQLLPRANDGPYLFSEDVW